MALFCWYPDLYGHSDLCELLHPGKFTWNPKMEVWKMIFLFMGDVWVHMLLNSNKRQPGFLSSETASASATRIPRQPVLGPVSNSNDLRISMFAGQVSSPSSSSSSSPRRISYIYIYMIIIWISYHRHRLVHDWYADMQVFSKKSTPFAQNRIVWRAIGISFIHRDAPRSKYRYAMIYCTYTWVDIWPS